MLRVIRMYMNKTRSNSRGKLITICKKLIGSLSEMWFFSLIWYRPGLRTLLAFVVINVANRLGRKYIYI